MGITSLVFSLLPKEKQDFILTSSVNTALNEEFSSVRSAACHAFGVITCFPQITQSVEILGKFIHAADINTRDPLVLVRITASWALANICDSLYHCNNIVTSKRCFVDLKVTAYLIVLLIECSLPLTKDSDKVMIKELKMLYDDSRSNSCIEHAIGIIEEEKAPENLSKKSLQYH
ncbi:HEAT repeat-containing protein 6 [Camellia lanceoleosa]|uniref:HEAT repeat-containing protein 6 n=1 Tax=Camellia lanceoleosa TaxID=1840588 RepID=A0ACC0GKT0_9ERIC|nr:HEAT repeat-containing protein 6 [Camellia lanceoleosa]